MEEFDTYTADLTSTIFALTSSIEAFTSTVTAFAQHPYDYAKSLYFDKDYVFPTINEITVPDCVTPEILVECLEQQHQKYQDTVLSYLSNPSCYDLKESGDQLNLLSTLSGDNKFVIPSEKNAAYISVLETLQNIKLEDINDSNSTELALKIGYMVNNVFK